MDEGNFPKQIDEEYLSPDMILSDSDEESRNVIGNTRRRMKSHHMIGESINITTNQKRISKSYGHSGMQSFFKVL